MGPQLFEKGLDVRPVGRPAVGQAKRIEAGNSAGVDSEPSGVQVVVHRLEGVIGIAGFEYRGQDARVLLRRQQQF